jgi:hypothetical protein
MTSTSTFSSVPSTPPWGSTKRRRETARMSTGGSRPHRRKPQPKPKLTTKLARREARKARELVRAKKLIAQDLERQARDLEKQTIGDYCLEHPQCTSFKMRVDPNSRQVQARVCEACRGSNTGPGYRAMCAVSCETYCAGTCRHHCGGVWIDPADVIIPINSDSETEEEE